MSTELSQDAQCVLDWAKDRGDPFTADDVAPAVFPVRSRMTLGLGALFNALCKRGYIEKTGRKVRVSRKSQAGNWYETTYLAEWTLK